MKSLNAGVHDMIWSDFKAAVEARGVTGETPIAFGQQLGGGVWMKLYTGGAPVIIDPDDIVETDPL